MCIYICCCYHVLDTKEGTVVIFDHEFSGKMLQSRFREKAWMARLLHVAFFYPILQYTIQPFYCQMSNNISLSLHFVYLGILGA